MLKYIITLLIVAMPVQSFAMYKTFWWWQDWAPTRGSIVYSWKFKQKFYCDEKDMFTAYDWPSIAITTWVSDTSYWYYRVFCIVKDYKCSCMYR